MGELPVTKTLIDFFLKVFGKSEIITIFAAPLDGPFVYRLGHVPFTDERGVRFPYGLQTKQNTPKRFVAKVHRGMEQW